MDYEKKYNEALEKAREMYNPIRTTICYNNADLEAIFPELAESEDEKIRKGLVGYFERIAREGVTSWTNLNPYEVLAWLEKQKAVDILDEEEREFADNVDGFREACDEAYQKGYDEAMKQLSVESPTYLKFTFDDVLAIQCCMETVKKVQEDKELYDELNLLHSKVYEAYQCSKQKPVEYDEENEKIREGLIGYFERIAREGDTSWTNLNPHEVLAWLEKQKEEEGKYDRPNIDIKNEVSVSSRMKLVPYRLKPIAEFILKYADWNLHKDEWNHPVLEVPLFRVLDALIQNGNIYQESLQNEDEKIREELLKHLQEGVDGYEPAGGSEDYSRWLSWLEKQKPAEWSGEDERMADKIIGLFHFSECFAASGINMDDIKEVRDWLKSLKDKCLPQVSQEGKPCDNQEPVNPPVEEKVEQKEEQKQAVHQDKTVEQEPTKIVNTDGNIRYTPITTVTLDGEEWYCSDGDSRNRAEERNLQVGDAVVYKVTGCQALGFIIVKKFDYPADHAARCVIGRSPYRHSDGKVTYSYYSDFAPGFTYYRHATEEEVAQFFKEFNESEGKSRLYPFKIEDVRIYAGNKYDNYFLTE